MDFYPLPSGAFLYMANDVIINKLLIYMIFIDCNYLLCYIQGKIKGKTLEPRSLTFWPSAFAAAIESPAMAWLFLLSRL